MTHGTDLLIVAEVEAFQKDIVAGQRSTSLNSFDLLKHSSADLHLDGYSFSGRLGAMLTIASFAVGFHRYLHYLSANLRCLYTQAQRGLVSDAGDHSDSIVSHLIEVGEIGAGNGAHEADFVSFGTNTGLIGDGVANLHVLQLCKIRVAAAIMAKQADVAIDQAGSGIVTGTLCHGCVSSTFVDLCLQPDAGNTHRSDTTITASQILQRIGRSIDDID